jgi:hypothetical protein
MRKILVLFTILLASIALVSIAYAVNVHLKPPNRPPIFMDNGLTLTTLGNLAGLGNGDILVTLDAEADATAVCINPGSGGNQPPGQNPAPVNVTGAQAIPADEIKNGNVGFNVTTTPPVTPIPGAPDCPNTQWTEVITDLTFTSATITVEQPPGTVVFTVTCFLSGPTSGTSGRLTSSGCP